MSRFVKSSVADTEQLESDLARAGVPDVKGGEQISIQLRHSAAMLRAVYAAYGKNVADYDPSHPAAMQRKQQVIGARVKAAETSILNDAVASLNLDPTVSDQASRNRDCQYAFTFTPQ